ncbi:MAG: Spy/CpxP family protein refolding chaperone [Bryobacterales bacterium]|nr:Spy/CpxP family protein refolding chaperone [Bryobacteraceae bacterium]MDW8131128.1 Spy/CpxP family protein refolding chaperone [Bryobacterales bacterium]
MKRRLFTILAAGVMLAAPAVAQWGRGRGAGAGAPATAEERLQRRLEFLATYLNLSEGQKAQFKTAWEALATRLRTLAQKELELRTKLQEAVRANEGAQAIQAIASELGKLHAERIAAQAQTMASLRGLLTQEQRDKLDKVCPRGCGLGLGFGRGARGLGFGGARI